MLEGRIARCSCGKEAPSSKSLAFFEYNGPDSEKAQIMCKCGYFQVAHNYFPYYYPGFCKIDHGRLTLTDHDTFICDTCWSEWDPKGLKIPKNPKYSPHVFIPIGDTTDTFYCGHGGWD